MAQRLLGSMAKMSEGIPRKIVQATPFQRFTIRLIDGKFVRVPKADLPSVEPSRQTSANNQTELRELFRLVNGRFTRVLNLDPDDDACIGRMLPEPARQAVQLTPMPIAKKKG